MEFQRRPSGVSQMSYSDSDLNLIGEEGQFIADLLGHSHFFAPSGNQRYSTPLVLISSENSAHNSTSSIPSSLATVTTGSTHNSNEASPLALSPTPTTTSSTSSNRPKKFSLNLNGHLKGSSGSLTPSSPSLTSFDQPDVLTSQDENGVHRGDQYINKERLAQDLSVLSSMPELCDVTFLVGSDRQPVCGVRAILAARSRVFRKMLYTADSAAGGGGMAKRSKKRQNQAYRPSDGYIEKYDFRGQPTVVVRDFEPEVFKQLIEYTHTGSVVLQARTLLGLLNVSDHYLLEDLKQACIRFMEHCITITSACSLLSSAEKYIQYKSTKILVQKILEFVDVNADEILRLKEILSLPQHVMRIVLSREELKTSEATKFEAAYNWCLHNSSDELDEEEIVKLFEPFVDVIDYNRISAKDLMQRVKPAGVVDDARILTALAYQADPNSVPPPPPAGKVRRTMTPVDGRIGGGASSRYQPQPLPSRFRRVQSSGNTLDTVGNSPRKSERSAHRDARGGSVPLEESTSHLDLHDGYMYPRGGSEVHPLRAHDVKERMDSQSSSHVSIMSTPPLSPTDSPSTTPSYHGSYQGSILSPGSSSDSVPILSQEAGPSSGAVGVAPIQQQGEGGGPRKKLSYNPAALDAIVNLSSTNAVEV